ncbi:ubiquinone/menaquinone biosynthesis C-methyltransferase UbiE [Candidatus Methanoplasma termitum]|uniref:UbiE protein n=1 Tax=Candidatus Methanoplasma termitum TaxID=1577791 RepID=A0A0A7LG16_9ARCH|nr:class I SAM-dependent methyltransferase [Candidatus Methanoplasma termitum]AIZ56451.1 ubiquinone/menaquinone biosynthesis C-methyltransferase UbiE [Candidatus Methanoplasma termitum]MCL2333551.1 class I SAM-dependent methyltransferase [Candidatus Methanoplasma sp.]
MSDGREEPEGGRQADHWERFYTEHKRPWRGIGKVALDIGPGSKVLDVGCGTGKTTAALLKSGADVTGLDFSPSAISQCISVFGDKAKFIIAECDKMPFPDDHFDAAAAVHILEHLDDTQLRDTVKEISRVLVPGGLVFVRVFAVEDMRAKGENRNTRGNGIEYRYFTEEEMKDIFRGFELISSERKDETMLFGAVRVKIECLFRLPR